MNAPLGSQALPRGGAEADFQSPNIIYNLDFFTVSIQEANVIC
jgi:hypothetical protein